ncbi:hypothetical protein BGX31_001853, partial [Mortierella sp. GBA43]
QPYTAASRGKRMAEQTKSSSRDRSTVRSREAADDTQHISGSSSVEGSFVSIVGNSSDEDDESGHKTSSGRASRDKSLPKGVLTATLSSKPTALPCKKVWKMIYLKQRALAEEEARERAEEMRRKAEEVFDIKMEEDDDSTVGANEPEFASPSTKLAQEAELAEEETTGPGKETCHDQNDASEAEPPSSIIQGDPLNLFREDVQLETSPTTATKDIPESPKDRSTEERTRLDSPAPVVDTVVQDRPRTPQKLSLESYHARRLASSVPPPSLDEQDGAASATAAASDPATAQVVKDVEMSEPEPAVAIANSTTEEAIASTDGSQDQKADAAPAVPKVKLSLQEYQKQRQGASQRSTALPLAEPSKAPKGVDPVPDVTVKQDDDSNSAAPEAAATVQESEPVDVEMAERPQETTATAAEGEDQAARDDYFQVGTSLPTPLSGLSSRAQGTSQPGDYFPVQPFSPISLSAGPTPFSKMNLTSSSPPPPPPPLPPVPPQPPRASTPAEAQPSTTTGTQSPARSPVGQRTGLNSSPKEPHPGNLDLRSPGVKPGASPPPPSLPSAGWRTPRHQRGPSPPAPSAAGFRGSLTLSDHRNMDSRSDGRLASPRYYGSPTDRPERSAVGPLTSPPRERQHSLTSGGMPTSPFDTGYSNPPPQSHYGYGEDTFKRPAHLASPTGPLSASSGPREYYKPDERARHRSMNGDEWYGGMDSPGYGGYRGPRGLPPRERDRDRDRLRERDHERDRERERRDRFERQRDYFPPGLPGGGMGPSGNNGNGLYGPGRGGPGGPGGMGGYGRRPSDYYGNPVREDGYGGGKKEGPSDNPSLPY